MNPITAKQQALLIKAICFATEAHRTQRRKDVAQTPYINHPIEVMSILSECGVTDTDTLCAAVLHDTIEDTDVTYEMLCEHFGYIIADIVNECSDNKSLSKVTRKKLQITHGSQISPMARLVKSADKLSNIGGLLVKPPVAWSQPQIDGYYVWSYAVWLEIKGTNAQLDAKLMSIFESRELTEMTPDDLKTALDIYYGVIE